MPVRNNSMRGAKWAPLSLVKASAGLKLWGTHLPAQHASHLFFDDRCFNCTLLVILRQFVIQSI
eukprot:10802088-Karenia_brevis.AAC.1